MAAGIRGRASPGGRPVGSDMAVAAAKGVVMWPPAVAPGLPSYSGGFIASSPRSRPLTSSILVALSYLNLDSIDLNLNPAVKVL